MALQEMLLNSAVGAGLAPTEVSTTDTHGVGTHLELNNKIYKWVKLLNTSATVAGAAGDAVGYVAGGGATSTVCLDMSDADTAPLGAGILTATITGTSGTAYYCWIQIKGYAALNTSASGSPAASNGLTMSATDKTLAKVSNAYDGIVAYFVATDKIMCDFPW